MCEICEGTKYGVSSGFAVIREVGLHYEYSFCRGPKHCSEDRSKNHWAGIVHIGFFGDMAKIPRHLRREAEEELEESIVRMYENADKFDYLPDQPIEKSLEYKERPQAERDQMQGPQPK